MCNCQSYPPANLVTAEQIRLGKQLRPVARPPLARKVLLKSTREQKRCSIMNQPVIRTKLSQQIIMSTMEDFTRDVFVFGSISRDLARSPYEKSPYGILCCCK